MNAQPSLQAAATMLGLSEKGMVGMPRRFELYGVPRRLALDGWWLSTAHEPGAAGIGRSDDPPAVARLGRGRWWQVLLIVGVADFLFWDERIGLSLAIFVLCLVLISGWGRPLAAQGRTALICMAGTLPVMNHLQPLSLLFLALGLTAGSVTLQGPETGLPRFVARMAGFLLGLPGQWGRSLLPVGRLRGSASVPVLMSPGRRALLFRD